MEYSSKSEYELSRISQRKNYNDMFEGEAVDCLICKIFFMFLYYIFNIFRLFIIF